MKPLLLYLNIAMLFVTCSTPPKRELVDVRAVTYQKHHLFTLENILCLVQNDSVYFFAFEDDNWQLLSQEPFTIANQQLAFSYNSVYAFGNGKVAEWIYEQPSKKWSIRKNGFEDFLAPTAFNKIIPVTGSTVALIADSAIFYTKGGYRFGHDKTFSLPEDAEEVLPLDFYVTGIINREEQKISWYVKPAYMLYGMLREEKEFSIPANTDAILPMAQKNKSGYFSQAFGILSSNTLRFYVLESGGWQLQPKLDLRLEELQHLITNAHKESPKGWSKDKKVLFTTKCEEENAGRMSTEMAKHYCECVLEKLQASYSNADSLAFLSAEETENISKRCEESLVMRAP